MQGLLTKAETYCTEKEIVPADIIQARLTSDMLPFNYQVKSTVAHSIGSINGVRAGVFSPDMTAPPTSFADLRHAVEGAVADLTALSRDEINEMQGRDMHFEMGSMRLPFTAENFLFSFSLPNFYFHATTAYDVLRTRGASLGKVDFLGPVRIKV